MISKIRKFARTNKYLREFFAFKLAPSGLFDFYFKNYKLSEHWNKRVQNVLKCEETKLLKPVTNAGEIINGRQIMHNGVKIYLGSYYGPEYAKLFTITKGIHEPEEEYIFGEILKSIPKNSTMIELGSFWSFYSMWFNTAIPNATNFMVEPDPFNIQCGQRNFKLNNISGDFTLAYVGEKSEYFNGNRKICIDDFIIEKQIDYIDILHSDIQGFEFDMLRGCKNSIEKNLINYMFISTHSNEVHYKCIEFLKESNFEILKSIDISNTHSEDGLIVAKNKVKREI